MAEFSQETQALLDRADRAIEESLQLRKERQKARSLISLALHRLEKNWPSLTPPFQGGAGE